MKRMKKFMALVIAMAMMLTMMSMTAFAEDPTYTITITAPTGHTYEIYQVFTGIPDDTTGQLTSLKYGVNSNGTAGEAVSQEDMTKLQGIQDTVTSETTDQEKIALLKEFVDFDSAAIKTVKASTASAALAPGYYVIRDLNDKAPATPEGETATLYIFQVLKDNLSMSAKSDSPSSEKKVKDEAEGYVDSADGEIGKTIDYQLTFTLPDNYDDYEHYYVNFKDTMSEGLTYNNDAKIFFGDADGQAITFEVSGQVYSYEIMDLKQRAADLEPGDVIKITYTCYLNAGAVIGDAGNPNTYTVEFSNNPNNTGDGTEKPDDTTETPTDKTIVFSYETIFNKVDEDQNPLTGADFTLYKKVDGEWVDVTTLNSSASPIKTGTSAGTQFSFAGLQDGEYKLEETTTPAGYNTISPIEFKITSSHDLEADDPQLTALTGTDGKTFTMTANVEDGTLSTSIENQSGVVLPSTGGIGTTIFYIVGAILVVGAGVVLITRRRMEA
jgi:fimbrial isopeptide formation D2 family protein/LPXTG-motif cell wall-anchored protein